jgi:hypothetical protein
VARPLLIVVLLLAVACGGCLDFLNSSSCGGKANSHVEYTSLAGTNPQATSDGVEWQLIVDDACSHAHADAAGFVSIDKAKIPAGCKAITGVTGTVSTAAFARPTTIVFSGGPGDAYGTYTGKADVGLEQGSTGDTASFTVAVRALYPMTNHSTDVDCVEAQITHMTITADYKHPPAAK